MEPAALDALEPKSEVALVAVLRILENPERAELAPEKIPLPPDESPVVPSANAGISPPPPPP
jgi:hypothetical protein